MTEHPQHARRGVLPLPLQASRRDSPDLFGVLLIASVSYSVTGGRFGAGMNVSIRGVGSVYLAAGLHQRPGWGMAPDPWQNRGGAVCRMASAKAGRRKAAQTKGLILSSEGGREAAVSPGLFGLGPRRREMRLKACSHAGQRVESDLFGFDFDRPF